PSEIESCSLSCANIPAITAVGGANRPMSRRMIQKQRAADSAQEPPPPPPGSQDEGYWAYMQRQLNERTEKLNIMGDSMDKLEESSSGFAEDVGKFVNNQKKKMILGSMVFAPPSFSQPFWGFQEEGLVC